MDRQPFGADSVGGDGERNSASPQTPWHRGRAACGNQDGALADGGRHDGGLCGTLSRVPTRIERHGAAV